MNYPIIKKAWKIKVADLEEPWHYDNMFEWADTSGKAKSLFMGGCTALDMRIMTSSGTRNVEYTDLKVSRCKAEDVVLFEGNKVARSNVEKLLWMKNRDHEAEKLVRDNPNSIFVVYAGCYGSYWGANRCGYASHIKWAGKYSGEDALDIVKGSDYSRQEVIKLLVVEEYNENINKEIEELQQKIERLRSCQIWNGN